MSWAILCWGTSAAKWPIALTCWTGFARFCGPTAVHFYGVAVWQCPRLPGTSHNPLTTSQIEIFDFSFGGFSFSGSPFDCKCFGIGRAGSSSEFRFALQGVSDQVPGETPKRKVNGSCLLLGGHQPSKKKKHIIIFFFMPFRFPQKSSVVVARAPPVFWALWASKNQ